MFELKTLAVWESGGREFFACRDSLTDRPARRALLRRRLTHKFDGATFKHNSHSKEVCIMPRIVSGGFSAEFEGEAITFRSSQESAEIITRLVNDLQTHESLKKFPAEDMRDFLSSQSGLLAAGEGTADSDEAVIRAAHEALDMIDKFAASISYTGLSLDEAIAWQEHGIVPAVLNKHAEYFTQHIIFTTGMNVTLSRLQGFIDALDIKIYSWGHVSELLFLRRCLIFDRQF